MTGIKRRNNMKGRKRSAGWEGRRYGREKLKKGGEGGGCSAGERKNDVGGGGERRKEVGEVLEEEG